MQETYKNPNENYFTQPISSATLSSNAQPLNLPQAPQDTTNYAGITTSIPTFDNLLNQTQQIQPAEKTASTLMERLLGTSTKLGQKGARQLEVEKGLGLPQFQTQLTDINNQLQGLQKEAVAIPLQLQEQVQGRGVTAGGLAPIQTGQLRQNAIKSLTLSAIGQTLQGNIANAQAQANRAVDLEFQPLEAELNTLKLAYDMNKDVLERQDKKRADALNLQIQERERGLQIQKEEKKYSRDLMLQAIQLGAPSSIAERMATSTPEEAMSIGSKYLGAEFKQKAEQLAFDRGIKTRELALKEAQFNLDTRKSLIELAKTGDSRAISQLGYDPNKLPMTTKQITALEDQIGTVDRDLQTVSRLLTNNLGLEKSAGLLRGGGVVQGVVGGVLEGGLGLGTLPYNLSKRNDFLADAKSIVTNQTFTKFRELADQGVKLTPVSNAEIKLIGDSAGVLSSSARYDDAGNLTGFAMSENKVREELRKIGESMGRLKLDIQGQLYLSNDERDEIAKLK